MIAGGDSAIRKFFPPPETTDKERQDALVAVHRRYNQVGITSIFERANNKDGYQLYQSLRDSGNLTVRSTHTIRQQFRSADQVASFTRSSGLLTGQGDDWVRVGPLKITVDGAFIGAQRTCANRTVRVAFRFTHSRESRSPAGLVAANTQST